MGLTKEKSIEEIGLGRKVDRAMQIPIRIKAVVSGFFSGLLFFIAVNVYSYNQMREEECFDCIKNFGFPFHLYESGTILHMEQILWYGLITDVLVAISVSIGIGLVCLLFRHRIEKAIR